MKKRKQAQTETLAESAVEPTPRIVHIIDLRREGFPMLCGASGDGPNEGSTVGALYKRANCPECLARLVLP